MCIYAYVYINICLHMYQYAFLGYAFRLGEVERATMALPERKYLIANESIIARERIE